MRTEQEIKERLKVAREDYKSECETFQNHHHAELELQWVACLEWVLGIEEGARE